MQERTDKRARKELKTNDVILIVQELNVTMNQNWIASRIFSFQTVLATSPRRLCRFSTFDCKVTRLIFCNFLFIYLFIFGMCSKHDFFSTMSAINNMSQFAFKSRLNALFVWSSVLFSAGRLFYLRDEEFKATSEYFVTAVDYR